MLTSLLNYIECSNEEMILMYLIKWSDYGAEGGYNISAFPPDYALYVNGV